MLNLTSLAIVSKMIRKAQIWVETVIYTLIILVIIGILLSILNPAINDWKDKALLDKSLGMIQSIDSAIEDVRTHGPGNSIPVDLQIRAGNLIIDGEKDVINFTVRSSHMYSEVNQTVLMGKINVTTIQRGESYDVSFKLSYSGILNLTWNSRDALKTFTQTPNAQKVWVTNNGRIEDSLINIDLNS